MLKRPCALVITLVVMLDPARLALTTTPSIGPSAAKVTCPASWAFACGDPTAGTSSSASAAVDTLDNHAFMRMPPCWPSRRARSPDRADRQDFGASLESSPTRFKDARRGKFGLVFLFPSLCLWHNG